MSIRVLAIGAVCGQPGLDFLCSRLPDYKKEQKIDFCVVNGENAHVVGVTPKQIDAMLEAGADAVTLGNHTWIRTELRPYMEKNDRVLRPANYAPQCPGRGIAVYHRDFGDICLMNLLGRFTMDFSTDNPFLVAKDYLEQIREKIILVDFHAEGTSEKVAMGYMLDGSVSAVWGTHTHVQTSDDRVLAGGTGYITDLGMTGPIHSVIGVSVEQSVGKFLGNPPERYNSGDGPCKMEGCIFTIEEKTGRCTAVEAIRVL